MSVTPKIPGFASKQINTPAAALQSVFRGGPVLSFLIEYTDAPERGCAFLIRVNSELFMLHGGIVGLKSPWLSGRGISPFSKV